MLQYRFGRRRLAPFAVGGLSVERLSELSGTGQLAKVTNAGVAGGGGLDLNIALVRLSAEVRYTRAGSANSNELLLGVHF